jgi:tRNA(His) 5'-end guanylyltransferase
MKDEFANRMKGYESKARTRLEPKTPVIGRIDGKAFHTLTRGMERPWDIRLQKSMWVATKHLCKNLQGCKLAYWQSDEVSVLLTDYEKETSQGWFDYKVEKMCSVGASLFTSAFLAAMMNYFPDRESDLRNGKGLPAFDARFFSIPKDEVTNYFIWRQKDAIRNSVQMLARAHFSHKDCANKDNVALKAMLLEEKGIDWEEEKTYLKSGLCVIRKPFETTVTFERGGEMHTEEVTRKIWEPDLNTPRFVEERDYIEKHL